LVSQASGPRLFCVAPVASEHYNKGMKRLFSILCLLAMMTATSHALDPEYKSVKGKTANVRKDSRKNAKITWKMWKYFVVEIVKYRGDWRLIRDFEGDEGWVHQDDLSDVRAVQVRGKMANLRKSPGGKVVWELSRGYSLRVFSRRGDWLEVSDLQDANGWIHVDTVWGMTKNK